MFQLWTLVRFGIALVAAVVLYLIGAAIVRNFNTDGPPDEPDVSTLEDVDYRFRCVVCGAQIVMYTAQGGEAPEPPRHCREPMALMAPIDDSGRPPS